MSDAYRFIAAEKANYPISLMSRMLGVSHRAYGARRIHAELRLGQRSGSRASGWSG